MQELNEKVEKDKEQSNTKAFAQNLEMIDRLVISIFLAAEKRCGLMRTKVYSDDICKQKQLVKYWKKIK